MAIPDGRDRRRCERICIDAGLEFFVDADIQGGECLDVSQTGLRFSSPEALQVELRLNVDGEREERRGRLVWARGHADGSIEYGLQFNDDEPLYEEEEEI